jgi:UDP-glucose 4-epimerase
MAETLLEQGWTIDVIDDLSTGSIENITSLKGNKRFSYILDTVMNRRLMLELVDRADVVFHFAAAVGVRLIVEQPVQTIETNIKSTEIVLDLCALKCKPLLITSTSEAYGKLTKAKFNEEDNLVLGPTSKVRWCYAASKIIDEFLAKAYFSEKKLPVVIVRLFNTIGPRQTGQYGMVVPRFVGQALRGVPITIYGDGSQRRSFTWIGDAVEAMISLIQNSRAYGEVFNIGHNKEISIYDLGVLVKDLSQSMSELVFVSFDEAYQPGFEDMSRRMPDISKIQKLIGYHPSLDLPEMLVHIIDFYRNRIKSAA